MECDHVKRSPPSPQLFELTQSAHETFDSRESTVTSRQHSVQNWFMLCEQHRRVVEEVELNH